MVSNIADFLTESERTYRLTQFPRFFQGRSGHPGGRPQPGYQGAANMKRLLSSERGSPPQLQGSENVGRDTVYLGIFSEHSSAARYLEANGILVGETLTTPFASGIPLEDMAVISLNSSGDRDVLVIMADSADSLEAAILRLQTGAFRNSLVNERYRGVRDQMKIILRPLLFSSLGPPGSPGGGVLQPGQQTLHPNPA